MNESDRDLANCANPIAAEVLADYWLAALPDDEEEAVEKHLLECDPCGARLRELIALAEGVRKIARAGSLRMVVSEALLQRAAAEGLRVREYAPPAGGSVDCTVTPEDDLLIGRLAADLSGAKRVDLCIYDERGIERYRMPDIPVLPAAGNVLFQESITNAKAAPTHKLLVRLVTVDEPGVERILGEYTFNHTRTMPGPPAGAQL